MQKIPDYLDKTHDFPEKGVSFFDNILPILWLVLFCLSGRFVMVLSKHRRGRWVISTMFWAILCCLSLIAMVLELY